MEISVCRKLENASPASAHRGATGAQRHVKAAALLAAPASPASGCGAPGRHGRQSRAWRAQALPTAWASASAPQSRHTGQASVARVWHIRTLGIERIRHSRYVERTLPSLLHRLCTAAHAQR